MDFSNVAYPEEMMARVERDAAKAVERRQAQITSIFPKAEALMLHGEYRQALLFFADKDEMAKYDVTLVDFLLCELFPEFEKQYQLYMADAIGQVKESISEDARRAYEHAMLVTLGVVLALRRDRPDDAAPYVRWKTVVALARDLASKAPKDSVTPQ